MPDDEEESESGWAVSVVECPECGRRWTAMRSIGTPKIECPNCFVMIEDPAGAVLIDMETEE